MFAPKNRPQNYLKIIQIFLLLAQNQPKSQFRWCKNGSPRDLCIMTLPRLGVKKVIILSSLKDKFIAPYNATTALAFQDQCPAFEATNKFRKLAKLRIVDPMKSPKLSIGSWNPQNSTFPSIWKSASKPLVVLVWELAKRTIKMPIAISCVTSNELSILSLFLFFSSIIKNNLDNSVNSTKNLLSWLSFATSNLFRVT